MRKMENFRIGRGTLRKQEGEPSQARERRRPADFDVDVNRRRPVTRVVRRMSEFSTLTTKLITPVLREKGFSKRGRFSRSPSWDWADYYRDNLKVRLVWCFHPYDYPELGIRLEVSDESGIRLRRVYPPCDEGAEPLIRSVLEDLKSGAAGV
jgi:hypothetical protein